MGDFEYVEGFDFGVIGYNQELSNELNSDTADALVYSKQLMDAWNPSTINASRYFQNDSSILYAPLVDTSNVTDMRYFLDKCQNLKVIPDYNYDKVANMQNFCSYSGNTSLNLDLKSCTIASMIASYNTSIRDVSINFNDNECDCYGLFYDCKNLSSVTLSNVKITDSRNIFYQCGNLATLNVNNVIFGGGSAQLFTSCGNLATLPLLNFENVTSIGTYLYDYTFYNATKLTDLGGFQNLGKSFTGVSTNNLYLAVSSKLTRQKLFKHFLIRFMI